MTTHLSSKIYIPQPAEPNCSIVGILEQLDPNIPTQGRKIALILHGAAGHKDYLFQKRLAQRLPVDSFRFDFRGNHETPGTWRQAGFENDKEDLIVVVDYLKSRYGYVVDMVVGHSRGSIVGFYWLCTCPEDSSTVTGFINASGRYRMQLLPTKNLIRSRLEPQGFYIMKAIVARKLTEFKIFPEDLDNFLKWDTSFVWERFPKSVDVLTIHGLEDKIVPPYDAIIYARALGNRKPGTHSLALMEGADHNFTGRQDEVVDTILDWVRAKDHGELKSGIWSTGVKGKL